MNISITLVHNKTDAENEAQIQALSSHLKQVTSGTFTDPSTGQTYTITHHEIKNLNISHQVKVYQVIPYGVTPPPSRYLINSGGLVYYGNDNTDKIGEHPRFFNWGLKRGTDNGADISIYLTDVSQFSAQKLSGHITAITKTPDPTGFIEDAYGKVATLKVLKTVGQLKENMTFSQAVSDLKTRITQKGLRHG